MKRAHGLAIAALLVAASMVNGAIHARPAEPPHPHHSKPAPENFGSYVVLCNGTDATFTNFATPDCSGPATTFSSPLGGCGQEFIPPIHRNLGWNGLCNSTHMWYSNFLSPTCEGEGLLIRTYNTGSCYACPNAECKDGEKAPENNFGPLTDKSAPWFENQWHTELGVAFVTSMNAGTIFKGSYDAAKNCVSAKACNTTHEPWIGGFKSISGITYDAVNRQAFALVAMNEDTQRNAIISFSVDTPVNFTVVVTAPDELNLFGNLTLNGLARHEGAKNVFYATNLGNFSAGNGAIYAIETKTGKFFNVMSNLTAADGAFVFKGKLYVSEVFSATVHVFDVKDPLKPVHLSSYAAPGMMSLDDFFVHELDHEEIIVGADWAAGVVRSWIANGTSNVSRVHAAGLLHPTSVRPELTDKGVWESKFVTITQGGYFPPTGTGANGGAVYRLRVKDLPPPIKSAGVLVELSYTDTTCNSTDITGRVVPLDECHHDKKTNTSIMVTCNPFVTLRQIFNGTECKGDSRNVTTPGLTCQPNGDMSTLDMCASL